MKTLVFAEKPSVGRDIARILGAVARNDGFLEGPEWVVTWGIGHLVSLAEPPEQNPSWKRWALETLPMIPPEWKLRVLEQTGKQFGIVKHLMLRPDIGQIVNAADAGREGELIFRLIYRHAGAKYPVKRLWISSMTDEAIRTGFSRLRPHSELDCLGAAAECRMRADWLVGLNFTRCYTKKMNVMLTLGRVQTPTLALIVDRHNEIQTFKPVPFWEVELRYPTFKAVWIDPRVRENPSRISSFELAQQVVEQSQGRSPVVHELTSTKKRQAPPLLYDLTTLQREANSRYGLTAAQTLKAAQSLYEEKKAITYPRTDSRYLSNDIFPTLPERLKGIPRLFEPWSRELLARELPRTKKVFDDKKVSDHHAIIPTERRINDTSAWKPDEKNVYDLIVRRFLAVFYPDYEYLASTLILEIEPHFFRAQGQVVIAPGWKALYEKDRPAEGEEEEQNQVLPKVRKGETLPPGDLEARKKETRPPPHFTEASILQAMETAGKLIEDDDARQAMKDCGLGTPATRAEILEKLIRVGYIVRDRKKLIPTPKGITLIAHVDHWLKSPEMTGRWEKRLADIARGQDTDRAFLEAIIKFVSELVEKVKRSRGAQFAPEQPMGSGLGQRTQDNSPASAASRRVVNSTLSTGSLSPESPEAKTKSVSSGRKTGETSSPAPTSGPAKKGMPGAVETPAGKKPAKSPRKGAVVAVPAEAGQSFGRPHLGTCPLCHTGNMIEGQRGFGCDRFRQGCSFVIWKEFLGKVLPATAIKALIAGKTTRILKGFTGESGVPSAGRLRIRPDGKGIELLPEADSQAAEKVGAAPGRTEENHE
jgi:DNA topoisomerase-3